MSNFFEKHDGSDEAEEKKLNKENEIEPRLAEEPPKKRRELKKEEDQEKETKRENVKREATREDGLAAAQEADRKALTGDKDAEELRQTYVNDLKALDKMKEGLKQRGKDVKE